MENFIVTNVTRKGWLTNRKEVSAVTAADLAEEEGIDTNLLFDK